MKALVFSDLQASDGSERLFSDTSRSLQEYRVEKFYREAAKIYTKHGCDAVWDGGDTLDDRNSVPITVIDIVGRGIELFPKSRFNFKIQGNHDTYLRNNEVHNGKLFSSVFRVIPGMEVIEHQDTAYFMCSYPSSEASLRDWIQENARRYRDSKKVLLGHFDVVGAKMPGGSMVTGIERSVLEPFDLVLLGHIHLPQSFGNIHFIGSPFQQDFAERDQKKRVAIFDSSDMSIEWVELSGFPEYHNVSFDVFVKTVTDKSEDRWQVVLKDMKETEKFFAHPLSSRAEPIYSYDPQDEVEVAAAGESILSLSTRDTLSHYLSVNPPDVQMDADEMVSIGFDIAHGT